MEERIAARITVNTEQGYIDFELQRCKYCKRDDDYRTKEEEWSLDSRYLIKDGMVDINAFSLMRHYERLGTRYFIRIV